MFCHRLVLHVSFPLSSDLPNKTDSKLHPLLNGFKQKSYGATLCVYLWPRSLRNHIVLSGMIFYQYKRRSICGETLRTPGAKFYTLGPVIISKWKNYFPKIDQLIFSLKKTKQKKTHVNPATGPLMPRAPKQLLGLLMASYATGFYNIVAPHSSGRVILINTKLI